MRKIFSSIMFFMCLGSATAQSFITSPVANSDTLKILAVMADFQEDKDEATTGNGKFGTMFSTAYGDTILDPLPHNKEYFSHHLKFAQNYFRKVSKGNLNLSYTIIDGIFTASQRMRLYSVPQKSTDYTPLGNFAREIWTSVKASNPATRFEDYDIFLIFHAGVGKDVSLPSEIVDSRDLPSIYLGDKILRKIFPQDLSGLPLNKNGQTNTMIIPETESRTVSNGVGGSVLLELSINGLIVSSIASHLGLPDLFNTKTGESAIDRFGLMDGQAIFTYGGTFPPEPSPWEKIFLGWETPVTSSLLDGRITLSTPAAAQPGDTTIFKIPLSASEYYLVENKIRDPQGDGVTVTYVSRGDTLTKHFAKDQNGFYYYDVSALEGVIIDVDDLNWAAPKNGGIVIWHIDENIINDKLADNTINADINKRGIDIEEADGVQQIGVTISTVLGDVVGEADSIDYWFRENKAKLYKNIFNDYSLPNTKLNNGAYSGVTLSDFSELSNRMSFSLTFGNEAVKPMAAVKIKDNPGTIQASSFYFKSIPFFSQLIDGDLFVINEKGGLVRGVLENFSDFKPVIWREGVDYSLGNTANEPDPGTDLYIAGVKGNILNIVKMYVNTISYKDTVFSVQLPEAVSGVPVMGNDLILPSVSGKIYTYRVDSSAFTLTGTLPSTGAEPIKRIAYGFDAGYYISASDRKIYENGNLKFETNSKVNDIVLVNISENEKLGIVLSGRNTVSVFSRLTGEIWSFDLPTKDSISAFSVSDIKNDGNAFILFNDREGIKAVNISGVLADNFPIEDPLGIGFSGIPVVGYSNVNLKQEIMSFTKDGRAFSVDAISGRTSDGFPIAIGSAVSGIPVLLSGNQGNYLSIVSDNGYFYNWTLKLLDGFSSRWSEHFASSTNNPFKRFASTSSVAEFMPKTRTYNWPNPVYDNSTYIRFFVGEDSRVNVKIFDLAGGFVDELNSNARGGMDNEIEWNVSNIQSGIYLARVEATGISGKNDHSIIKIAVIK